jgi:hypothetical protein
MSNTIPLSSWQRPAGTEAPAELACPICLENCLRNDPIGHIANARQTTEVFHAFHRHCLEEWLRRNPSCPTCKAQIGAPVPPPIVAPVPPPTLQARVEQLIEGAPSVFLELGNYFASFEAAAIITVGALALSVNHLIMRRL